MLYAQSPINPFLEGHARDARRSLLVAHRATPRRSACSAVIGPVGLITIGAAHVAGRSGVRLAIPSSCVGVLTIRADRGRSRQRANPFLEAATERGTALCPRTPLHPLHRVCILWRPRVPQTCTKLLFCASPALCIRTSARRCPRCPRGPRQGAWPPRRRYLARGRAFPRKGVHRGGTSGSRARLGGWRT